MLMYRNSFDYIEENKDIVSTIYNILINHDRINTVTHSLSILFLICNFLGQEGVKSVWHAAESYAKYHEKKIFLEVVNFLNDNSIDIKVNTLTLICMMLQNISDKNMVIICYKRYHLLLFIT